MRFTSPLTLVILYGLADATAIRECSASSLSHSRPSLKKVTKSFYRAQIVPDVLPVFEPTSLLYLTYVSDSFKDHGVVLPGKKFKKEVVESQPEISLEGPSYPGGYIFFLLDPDAPSRSDPKWAQVRHMFAGNLTIGGNSTHVPHSVVLKNATSAVNEYMPPAPPASSGRHRYIALLYAQPPTFDYSFLNTTDRYGFNITEFSIKSGLGAPLAGTFLTVKVKGDKDPYWLPVLSHLWSYWVQVAWKIIF